MTAQQPPASNQAAAAGDEIDWANVASEVGEMIKLNEPAQAALAAQGGEQALDQRNSR